MPRAQGAKAVRSTFRPSHSPPGFIRIEESHVNFAENIWPSLIAAEPSCTVWEITSVVYIDCFLLLAWTFLLIGKTNATPRKNMCWWVKVSRLHYVCHVNWEHSLTEESKRRFPHAVRPKSALPFLQSLHVSDFWKWSRVCESCEQCRCNH